MPYEVPAGQTTPFVDLPSVSTPVTAGWLNEVDDTLEEVDGTPYALAALRGQPLDIWDAFTTAGGTGSWSAATYANWITGIDALFAAEITATTIVKANLGLCSDATNSVYSYTAGPARAPHLLLIGGNHGDEYMSPAAAMRWFQQYATGTHPAMAALRRVLRVTWIPYLNPSGYRSNRENSNSVNINRNFPFYWAYYTPGAAEDSKGSAALDQPEADMVRDLIDANRIAAVVDCHTTRSSTPDTMQWASASPYAHTSRNINFAAGALWSQLYRDLGAGDDAPQELTGQYGIPDLVSWAVPYMRHDLARYNAAGVTVEGPEDWHSSSSTSFTRNAIQRYCGFITLWVATWLAEGQTPTAPQSMLWRARRTTISNATALASGGTLLSTNGASQYVEFDDYNAAGSAQSYLDVVLPYPGRFEVSYTGQLESLGGTAGVVYINLWWGVSPSTSEDFESGSAVVVSATSGQRFNFSGQWTTPYYSTVGTDLYRIRLAFYKDSPTGNVGVIRPTVLIRSYADDDVWTIPGVGGSL